MNRTYIKDITPGARCRISGFVEKIYVQNGQFVKEGQLLMILKMNKGDELL